MCAQNHIAHLRSTTLERARRHRRERQLVTLGVDAGVVEAEDIVREALEVLHQHARLFLRALCGSLACTTGFHGFHNGHTVVDVQTLRLPHQLLGQHLISGMEDSVKIRNFAEKNEVMSESCQTRRMYAHDYSVPGTYEVTMVVAGRRTNGVPTENTEVWTTGCQALISAANSGDVLVTPGISECEKRIKKMALAQKLRLIHVQADPIGRYWKPERSRFEACAYGSLLILAPWPEDMPTFASDYARFHYLNHLAEMVCAIGHTTNVAVQGLRHTHGG